MSKCNLKINGVSVANAETSPLYKELEEYFQGDVTKAVSTWGNTHLPEFINPARELTLEEALVISETLETKDKKLDIDSKLDVLNIMQEKGFENSKDLLKVLNDTFRSKGYFEIDYSNLKNSGLYLDSEISEIINNASNHSTIANTIRALDNEDNFIQNEYKPTIEFIYKKSNKTNALGGYSNIPFSEVEESLKAIAADTDNISEFISAVEASGFNSLSDRMNSDSYFSDKIYDQYKDTIRIPKFEIIRGKLTEVPKGVSKSDITRNVLEGVSSTEIIEDINFLQQIDKQSWVKLKDSIVPLLKEVEKEATKFNIDVIGVSEHYENREGILQILRNLEDLTLLLDKGSVDTTTVNKFTTSYNELFNEVAQETLLKSKTAYPENTVYINTTAYDQRMFDDYGLVHLGKGFYHAVDMEVSNEDLENAIINSTEETTLNEVKSKKPLFNTDNKYKLNLYTELYSYEKYIKKDIQSVNLLTVDSYNKFKTTFTDSFYNFKLNEKQKNSNLYNNILKYITVDSNGINSIKELNSLKDILSLDPILKDLKNYAALRKNSGLEYLQDDLEYSHFDTAFKELNSSREFSNKEFIKEGDFLLIEETSNFIEIENTAYQKVNDNLYLKVGEIDPVFNLIPYMLVPNLTVEIMEKSIKFNKMILDNPNNLLSLSSDKSLREVKDKIECNG